MTGLGKMIETWRDWRRVEREIASFPAGELQGMGMTRAEFRAVAHMPAEQVDRMDHAAEIFGMSPGTLARNPQVRTEVARTCAQCGENGRCRSEMTDPRGTTAERMAFCPNAATYRGLAGT